MNQNVVVLLAAGILAHAAMPPNAVVAKTTLNELRFVENGCVGVPTCFQVSSSDAILRFKSDAPTVELAPGSRPSALPLNLQLVGASRRAAMEGEGELPGKTNYLPSGDPATWRTNLRAFRAVRYRSVYPGIDLVYYGTNGRLEYDFEVSPGADPRKIAMDVKGARSIALNSVGDLLIDGFDGSYRFSKPAMYQLRADGTKAPVAGSYIVRRNKRVSFRVAAWDRSRRLVIDPVLAWSTYTGNTGEQFSTMTTDATGNVFLAGRSAGALVVEKLSTDGATVLYHTVFGSGYSSSPQDIAVDGTGKVYVVGVSGLGFPTTATAFRTTVANGLHAFIAVLASSGASLTYASYLAGASTDQANGVAVDATGKVYLAGTTFSNNMPVSAGAFQATLTSGQGGFVAKFDPALSGASSLLYLTYFSGPATQTSIQGIAIDGSGNAYITGAGGSDLPSTPGAYFYDGVGLGQGGVYVAKLNAGATALLYSAILGPGSGAAIAVDGSGDAYIAGTTAVEDFPTTPGVFQNKYPGAFISELNAAGSNLVYSTLIGGPSAQATPTDLAIPSGCASACSVTVAGFTSAMDYSLANAIQAANSGPNDIFVTQLNGTGTAATYSTYLGGSGDESSNGYSHSPSVALAGSDTVVAAITASPDFPLTLTTTPVRSNIVARISSVAAATAVAVPAKATFTNQQPVHTPSAPQTVVLNNLGSAAMNITSIAVAGDFSETDTCGASIAAGANCPIVVTFTPTVSGARTGSITVTHSGNNSPYVISLAGTGLNAPFLSLSQNTITFSPQTTGTASAAQSVTLKNTGNQSLTLSGFTISSEFSQTNNCPASVAAGGTCTINISFLPLQSGPRTGSLGISSNSNSLANATIALGGTGVEGIEALTVMNKGLVFAPQVLNTPSTFQQVAIVNSGTAPVTIFGTSATLPDYAITGCLQTLNPGGSCNVRATFTPTATGARSATVTLADSTPTGLHTFTATGTGVAPAQTLSLSSSSLTFPDQPVGGISSNFGVVVTNTGNRSVSISRVFDTGDFRLVSTSCINANFRPGFSCSMTINFSPTATGARTGSITIVSTATGSPQTISLAGNGITAVKAAQISPANLAFSSQAVGTTSAAQLITLFNTGNLPIAVSVPASAGDFQTSTSCGATLLALRSCNTSITFTPTAAGTRTATLTFTTDAGSKSVSLSGTGVTSTLTLGFTPASLTFPAQQTTITSPTRNLIVRNTGTAPVTITNMTASGDYAVASGACITTVPIGGSCTVQVTFTPTATGTRTGTISITDNASGSPQSVSLSGTGTASAPSVVLSPAGLAFNTQVTGTTSNSQGVQLTNKTASSMTAINLVASGDFSIPTTCASTLAANSSCFFTVAFTPTAAGARTGAVTITDNLGTQTVSLAGFGASPAPGALLRESSLKFADTTVGLTTLAQNVTLTNTGNVAITVTSAVVGGTNPGDFVAANNCSSIVPGFSCTIGITFAPTATGARSATLTITDSGPGSPRAVALTGNGVASALKFSADRTALTFPSTPVGVAATLTQNVTLTNYGDAPVTVSSVTPTGADYTVSNGCSTVPPPPNGNSCTLSVGFTPTAAGTRTGSITVAHTAGSNIVINLSGAGVTDAKTVVVSPNGLIFPPQVVNQTSAAQTVTVTNTGNFVVTFSAVTINGNYSMSNACVGQLTPGASCSVSVSFTPTASGSRTGTLSFSDDATGTPQSVTLTGTGIPATSEIALSETSMTFPPQLTNVASQPQDLIFVNESPVPITISSVTISTGDFTENHVCDTATVGAGSSCKMLVTFKPLSTGLKNATLTITDNGPGSPRVVNLSGLGSSSAVPWVTLLPGSLTFNSQMKGTTSAPQVVNLTNAGSATLTVANIQITGTNSGDFAQTSACPTVPAGFSCPISITFTPTAVGARTATLTITDSATGSPHTVTLTGPGTQPALPVVTLTPTSLAFPNVPLNTASAAKTVTVKNTGQVTLTVSSITVTGTVPSNWTQTNNCTSVAVSATCAINVTFTPSSIANQTGTVTINDNAADTPQTVSLTGNGTAASVVFLPSSINFGSQTVGTTSAVHTVTIENSGNAPLTISSIVTSAATEFIKQSTTCPATLNVGLTCTVGITFKPAASGARTGYMVVTDNAGDSPQYLVLLGTGN